MNESGTSAPGDEQPPTGGLPPELSPRGRGGHAAAPAPQPSRRSSSGGGNGGGNRTFSGPPSKRRRGLGMKIAAAASAFIVLGSATGYAVSQHYLGEVTQIDAFKGITDRPDKVDVPAQNILIAGADDRGDLTPAQRREYHVGSDIYGKRSDTMILLHVSDNQKTITAVSLPRDSLVTIPAYTDAAGKKHPAQQNKLNAAFAFGGSKLTIETIEKATGIRIDHYVEVDLGGFVRMVNAIGGVDVCVTDPISDKDSNLQLPAGKSHLNGVQSLAFVRARHIYADQDLGRIKAQQKFVGSMIKRATSKGILLDPLKLNRFLSAAVKSIDTDMSKDELLDEMKMLRDFKPGNVSFLTVPISNSNLYVPGVGSAASWNKKQSKELFTKLRNDEPIEKKTTAGKLTVLPGAIQIQVLNGAGVQGLGSQAADDLARLGFGMADVAKNADVSDQTGTVVKYDPTNVAASRTVIAAIPGATGLAVAGLGTTIEVVVGSTYKGAKAVSVTGSTSSKPKARTAADDICK